MITDELIAGRIPDELNEKSTAVRAVSNFARRAVPLTAMLIAAAWRDNFQRADYSGWADWCLEYAGIDKADKRAHLHSIGKMLLAVKEQPRFARTFERLYALDSEKLLCLTRLVKPGRETDDVSEVITFANHYPVAEMSRDRMRRLVKRWLDGNPAGLDEEPETESKPQTVQQDLPGFERSLDLLHDLKPETASPMIKTTAAAEKSIWGGYVLIQSALAFSESGGTVKPEDLDELKARLLDMADAIDRIRDRQAEAEEAAEIAAGGNGTDSETAAETAPDTGEEIAADGSGTVPEAESEVAAEIAAEPYSIAAAATKIPNSLRKSASTELPQRQRRPKTGIAAKGAGGGFDIAEVLRNAEAETEEKSQKVKKLRS